MDDLMKIHLLIDGQRYPMTIPREKEQLYRDAAKQIDNKLNKYRGMFAELTPYQYTIMVALELAFENCSLKDKNDTAPYKESIEELTKELESIIKGKE